MKFIAKDTIHIGDVIRRLWKKYCRRCVVNDSNKEFYIATSNARAGKIVSCIKV